MNAVAMSLAIPARRRIWVTRGFCAGVLLLFLLSSSAWHEVAGVVPHLLTPLGILLAAVGALGRLWCSSYIAGNKNSRLMTNGPYSLTRNPLYLFTFIGGMGIAITTETLLIPLLFAAWFAWYYRDVIAGEERQLLASFGAPYRDYLAHVPRFWPRLAGYAEPPRWDISPACFRRSLTEVVWFVVAAIAMHALHDLRGPLALPSLFALY